MTDGYMSVLLRIAILVEEQNAFFHKNREEDQAIFKKMAENQAESAKAARQQVDHVIMRDTQYDANHSPKN